MKKVLFSAKDTKVVDVMDGIYVNRYIPKVAFMSTDPKDLRGIKGNATFDQVETMMKDQTDPKASMPSGKMVAFQRMSRIRTTGKTAKTQPKRTVSSRTAEMSDSRMFDRNRNDEKNDIIQAACKIAIRGNMAKAIQLLQTEKEFVQMKGCIVAQVYGHYGYPSVNEQNFYGKVIAQKDLEMACDIAWIKALQAMIKHGYWKLNPSVAVGKFQGNLKDCMMAAVRVYVCKTVGVSRYRMDLYIQLIKNGIDIHQDSDEACMRALKKLGKKHPETVLRKLREVMPK